MPKKKKQRSAKRTVKSKQITPKPKKSNKFSFIALGVGIALVLAGAFFSIKKRNPQNPCPRVHN